MRRAGEWLGVYDQKVHAEISETSLNLKGPVSISGARLYQNFSLETMQVEQKQQLVTQLMELAEMVEMDVHLFLQLEQQLLDFLTLSGMRSNPASLGQEIDF